jgi:5-methylcytosine-specific restriction enzyme A
MPRDLLGGRPDPSGRPGLSFTRALELLREDAAYLAAYPEAVANPAPIPEPRRELGGRRRRGDAVTIVRLCPRSGVKKPTAGPCDDCRRKGERERSRRRRATSPTVNVRNSRLWQRAREAAKQRDGHRCGGCGLSSRLSVHHITPIEQGGEPFPISNLVTLCRRCHEDAEREAKSGFLSQGAHTRPPALRERKSQSPEKGPAIG